MRQKFISVILVCVLSSGVFAALIVDYSDMACRTRSDDTTYDAEHDPVPAGDGSNHDSSKLTIRQGDRGEKSWIRFDGLDPNDLGLLRSAELRITLHADKSGECDVSAVNDDCHDNDNWVDYPNNDDIPNGIWALTWNNAPGNDTANFATLDTSKTSVITRLDYDGGLAGDQFFIDVLAVLQADTDGTVQFALSNSTGDTNFSTWDHPMGVEYYPALFLTYPPEGADWPNPDDGANTVSTSLASLSWTNPDPNSPGDPIYCDVYFGKDPNRPQMQMVTLGNGVETVAVSSFTSFTPLENYTTYYWVVDCHDLDKGVVPGEMWSFYTNNNQAPDVNAGGDKVIWLGQYDPNAVTLDGVVTDDGLPEDPGALTITWTRTSGPISAVIDPNDQAVTTVTFTEAGDYTFTLTASDGPTEQGGYESSDTVRVVVGTDSCDASHVESGDPYNPADENQDCIVNLPDFMALIAEDWLNCTDTLTSCGQ